MKAILAVARRELIEKRFVFATALALSVMAPLIPLVRGMTGGSAREVREFLAVFAGCAFAAAVAAGLGASVLAADVARGHSGFYFSRPLSSFSIWFGKLAASLGMALGAGFLVAAPTLLADGRLEPLADLAGSTGRGLLLAAAAVIVLFLAAHAVATMLRSRSLLALADLVLAVAVGFLTWDALRRLSVHWAESESLMSRAGAAGALVAGAVLLAAMHRSVDRGRTDAGAAHRALSATVWPGLFAAALALTIYSRWALAAPATALSRVHSASFLSNGWVAVEGRARGLLASYLYDVRSGRSQRYESSSLVSDPTDRVAVWSVPETRSGPWTVHVLRLDDPKARDRETKIVLRSRWAWPLFLTSGGARLAAVEGKLLTVYDVEDGRALASFPVRESDESIFGTFASPDVVRMLRVRLVSGTELRRAEILEANILSRTLSVTGAADLKAWATVLASPYRDEILVNEGRGIRIAIRDPRTLAVRGVLREGDPLRSSSAWFLADGRLVLALDDEKQSWMEVFGADRVLARRIPLGAVGRVRLAGETSNGRILACVTRSETTPGQPAHAIEAVDLSTGTVEHVADGLVPTLRWWWWWEARRTDPGSEATRIFLSDDGKLVRLDPATRQRQTLLGR
jgi:hypothetical protein